MFVTAAASSPSWLIRIVSSWLTSSVASATGLLCSPPCLPGPGPLPWPCKHCPHPAPPSPHLTCFKQGEEGERAGAGGHRPGVWLWGRTARVWRQPSWDPAFHLFQRILLEPSVGGFVLQACTSSTMLARLEGSSRVVSPPSDESGWDAV